MTPAGEGVRTHTPGPWCWFGNAKNNEVYLATKHSGRRYVMGFDRWGMRGAQPRFQPEGRGLVPAADLLMFEVGDQSVRGVEAAKADESVYRLDIRGIDCADARLIASAPCQHEAAAEIDRLSLIILSAVKADQPAQYDAVVAALLASRAALTAARGMDAPARAALGGVA